MRRVAAAPLFALVALVGCADSAELASIRLNCFTANECGPGSICIDNVCVPNMSVGPEVVHVEVDPPPGSPFARTQILDATAIGGLLNVSLPIPTEFDLFLLDAENNAIGGEVVVKGEDRIPGREIDLIQGLTGIQDVLRLRVGEYTVRVLPNNPMLPGFEADRFTVRSSAMRQRKELIAPVNYRMIEGRVVSAVASSSTISGVLVQAVGVRSGLPSTSALSDEEGRYQILLPDAVDERQFLLTASLQTAEGPAWSFSEEVKVEGMVREKQIDFEPTDPNLPGAVKLKILGSGTERGPEPVRNAKVTLTATSAFGLNTRQYEISGTTDSEGFVRVTVEGESRTEVPVLAARYLVRVEADDGPYASGLFPLDLSAAGANVLTEQLELSLRTVLVGAVVSAFGLPVRDATVELISEDRIPLETETDADGGFAAEVDPGRYLLVIRPPRSINGELLPVHTVNVNVQAGTRFDVPTINLPRGIEVNGTVSGEDVGAIANADVKFYIRDLTSTVRIARAVTDRSGRYSVVLPDQQR